MSCGVSLINGHIDGIEKMKKVVLCNECNYCIENDEHCYSDKSRHSCELCNSCFDYENGFCSDGVKRSDAK